MRILAKLLLLAAIVTGAYYVYQRPEIRGILEDSEPKENPLAFLEDLPEVNPQPIPDRSRSRRMPRNLESKRPSESAVETEVEEPEPVPEYQNQVPTEQLRKVFMQILAAKKLTDGISLSVSDKLVSIAGTVASSEQR
ncbi:MAG: hypothetical protein ACWGQW_08195, partial [bacterium]